jgi:putative oxidoreductase
MKRWSVDAASLLLRVACGLIFLPHGWSKVFGSGGVGAFAQDLPQYHVPVFLGYVAAYAEMFGALLLIAGLLTRLDAFLLACTMFVAVFVVQLPDAIRDPDSAGHLFASSMRAIELPLALFAITAAIVLIGPGRFSLDHPLRVEERLGKRKRRPEAAADSIPN